MRSAVVLAAALAACACTQNAAKDPPQETQPTAPAGAPTAAGSSGGIHFAYAPDAPNWKVTPIKLSDNHWRLELRMRRWHTGGAGEAELLFRQEAQELAAKQGYLHYVVLNFTEGIESTAPIAQRWARGEIVLQDALPPMPLYKP